MNPPPAREALDAFLAGRESRVREAVIHPSPGEMVSFFPGKFWPGMPPLPGDDLPYHGCLPQSLRPGLLWSRVKSDPYCRGAFHMADRHRLPRLQDTNSNWEETLKGLNHVGPDGHGGMFRPEGEFILDLTRIPGGYDIMEAAHVVAHMRALAYGGEPRLLECLAEIGLSMRYGVSFHCPVPGQLYAGKGRPSSWLEVNGIVPVVSTNPRKPWLSIPVASLAASRAAIAVLVGVHLEPQPWSAREGAAEETPAWLEVNRWSCMPSILSFSGWKAVDELLKGPMILPYRNSPESEVYACMPVEGLDPMSMLDALAREYPGDPGSGEGLFTVDSLLNWEGYRGILSCTPPFPCRKCLRLNMMAPGAPERPMKRRPSDKEMKENPSDGACVEWAAYDAKVERIMGVVEKACEFHDLRFGLGKKFRKERKRNAKRLGETLDKIESRRTRAVKLRKDGELTKAVALEAEINELKESMLVMMAGGKEDNAK